MQPAVRPRRYRRWLWPAVIAVVLLAVAYSAVRITQAARQGTAGRAALLGAEEALRAKDTQHAETLLRQAQKHFAAMHSDIAGLGPLLPVAKVIPLVRIQVRAAETLATVGEQLSTAGVDLAHSAQGLLHPAHPHLPLGEAVDDLKSVDSAAARAVTVLDSARSELAPLDGYRLLGPFSSARTQLDSRLAKAQARGHDLVNGLSLLLDIVGANGPRRYLLLTQNPDEIRPTGGYIGTYGVIVANGGHVKLAAYGPSGTWASAHPKAAIPIAGLPAAVVASANAAEVASGHWASQRLTVLGSADRGSAAESGPRRDLWMNSARFHKPVQVGVVEANVRAELDVGDAPLSDQPTNEPWLGGKPHGGFIDGQQGHGRLLPARHRASPVTNSAIGLGPYPVYLSWQVVVSLAAGVGCGPWRAAERPVLTVRNRHGRSWTG